MQPTDNILASVARDGFALKDDFLPGALFAELDALVLAAWRDGTGWRTRVKGPGRSSKVPLQSGANVRRIGQLLDQVGGVEGNHFSYLYHQLHVDDDVNNLVRRIEQASLEAWGEATERLIGRYDRTNFSLTAFTAGCRLSPHTDHGGKDAYRLTMLLYFTGEGGSEVPLMFGDETTPVCIAPRPNRSVIFLPSPATTHWIAPVPIEDHHTARLAFSGWLL
jgi:hypothetical protein